eukprot:2196683-Alexandrium_andersonii.AAC.1
MACPSEAALRLLREQSLQTLQRVELATPNPPPPHHRTAIRWKPPCPAGQLSGNASSIKQFAHSPHGDCTTQLFGKASRDQRSART